MTPIYKKKNDLFKNLTSNIQAKKLNGKNISFSRIKLMNASLNFL